MVLAGSLISSSSDINFLGMSKASQHPLCPTLSPGILLILGIQAIGLLGFLSHPPSNQFLVLFRSLPQFLLQGSEGDLQGIILILQGLVGSFQVLQLTAQLQTLTLQVGDVLQALCDSERTWDGMRYPGECTRGGGPLGIPAPQGTSASILHKVPDRDITVINSFPQDPSLHQHSPMKSHAQPGYHCTTHLASFACISRSFCCIWLFRSITNWASCGLGRSSHKGNSYHSERARRFSPG